MSTTVPDDAYEKLKALFDRDVCQRATKPLRDGVKIAVYVGEDGPLTLSHQGGRIGIFRTAPTSPDMTFHVPPAAIDELCKLTTEDIGEVGIAIIQQMMNEDPNKKIRAKVHIGTFDLLRHGYLGILPLGGGTVMKHLASKGFSNIGKIKDAVSKMRS